MLRTIGTQATEFMKWFGFFKESNVAVYMEKVNVIYKNFFDNGSWYFYFLSSLIILLSAHCLIVDLRKKNILFENRREMRQEISRGQHDASFTDHEIYQAYIKLQQYFKQSISDKRNKGLDKHGDILGFINEKLRSINLNNGKYNKATNTTSNFYKASNLKASNISNKASNTKPCDVKGNKSADQ